MIILFAAGNEGVDANRDGYVDEGSMGSPSTAKNCITSGASENERSSGGYNPGGPCSTWGTCWPSDYPVNPTKDDGLSTSREELAAFSSRGPTDDGRIKPDVVAPGTNIVSTRSGEISGHGWGPYPNSDYMYMGGTSMANPLIAGAATLVREYYVEGQSHTPSAALVKATLINSAADIAGYGAPGQEAAQPIPNNHEGWGRVDVGAATSGSRKYRDGETVSTGANKTYHYQVGSSAQPFKATLAWGDYPGSLPSGGLVNDLHLVVTAPGGTVYRGNHLNNGWSTSGGSADGVNNVESVYIQNPAPGEWTVRVEGANVPHGPQPFALVVTGQFGPPPVYDNWLYLPLAVKDYGSGASPGGEIVNGDFEDGPTGWTEYSSHSWDLIMDSGFPSGVTPHGGSWAVWLGGGNNEVAYVEQQVTVPTSKPYLHYWHWIDSAEFSCGYDFARVRVNGTPVEVYDLCMSENTGGWEEHVVDLSAYGGQSVSLQLRAETDALFSSSLFIDDVSFQASGR